jgi:hypothetical protein
MKPRMLITGLLVVGLALLVGCDLHLGRHRVRGSGKLARETRTVPSFQWIEILGAAKFDVKTGAPQSVVVEADDNIAPLIETEVSNGRLRVSAKESYRDPMDHGVKLTITVAELKGVEISGACSGAVGGLAGGEFRAEISGAGTLDLAGAVDALEIEVAGAASVDSRQLTAKRADVDVAGAGRVRLTATEELKARVSGVGDIRYAGNPAKVEQKILGVGRIAPL